MIAGIVQIVPALYICFLIVSRMSLYFFIHYFSLRKSIELNVHLESRHGQCRGKRQYINKTEGTKRNYTTDWIGLLAS